MEPVISSPFPAAVQRPAVRPASAHSPASVSPSQALDSPSAPSSDRAPSPVKENGVLTSVTAEGAISKVADSGLSLLTTAQGQQVRLPSGESFELTSEGLRSLTPEAGPAARLSKTADDLLLITFADAEGNTVQVQPESLTYEVLNRQKNLAQVFHPDGHQEVVAFGRFRTPEGAVREYEHRALFDATGAMKASEGFQGVAVEGRKLRFELDGGVRTERTLARPLPGQAPFSEAAPVAPSVDPLAPLGQQPWVAETAAPAGLGATTPVAQPQPTPSAEAKVASPFPDLPDLHQDFFAGADQPGVAWDQTASGLVVRHEGETRAYLLPNGDRFRTDGHQVEVLGHDARVKNARLVVEGEAQLLAYSDADGQRHALDLNSGDYEVSNRQGSLTQRLKADGTQDYLARGTYTSEAGRPVPYELKATVTAEGTLIGKEGFDDLQLSGSRMAFTLPNGVETERTLVMPSAHEVSVPKRWVPQGGVAQEWGAGLALAEALLSGTSPADASSRTAPSPAERPTPKPGPGLVRVPVEGGALSVLPNGVTIFDNGVEATAHDAEGRPLEIQRSQLASEAGTTPLLTVRTPDGVSYTTGHANLDLIVQSADGKVHQLIGPDGRTLTSIHDQGNQHLMEFHPVNGVTGSPGTRFDPRTPDRLWVDGPAGPVSYAMPHAVGPRPAPAATPAVPSGLLQEWPAADPSFLAGPGQTAQGFRPEVWQQMPFAPSREAGRSAEGGRPDSAPFPSQDYRWGPADQMREMERMNQMTWMSTMGMSLINQMQVMSMMVFSPMGMVW